MSAVRVQKSILHALLLRDMHARYAGSRIGVLVEVFDALLQVAFMIAIRYVLKGKHGPYGMSLAVFVTTGYLTFYIFRVLLVRTMAAMSSRASALMFPLVTDMDVVVAAVLSTVVTYALVLVLCFATAVLLFGGEPPRDLLGVIGAAAMMMWLGTSCGMVMGVIVRIFPGLRILVGPALRIGMYASGALYLASELPAWLLPYVVWNPTFHVIEMMREGWIGTYDSPVASLSYVLEVGLIATLLGLALERTTGRFALS